MGILDLLGVGKRRIDYLSSTLSLNISSPYSIGDPLEKILFPDLFGDDFDTDSFPMTRAEAITIPAVSKARNLLISTIAKFPLVCVEGKTTINGQLGKKLDPQPTFLYRTDSNVTPYERMAWTIDDLIFYGYSLWARNNGSDGKPLSTEYVPMRDWKITNGRILVNDQPVDATDVILFNSPFEGILNIGSRTLRGAIGQEKAWVARAMFPLPLVDLHRTDDSELTDKEVADNVAAWAAARRSPFGAIGSTPAGLELNVPETHPVDMSIEGRNAIRTDVGSFLNVRAAMLDGTVGVDSLTYTTKDGEKNAFYELDVPFWTDPITTRLSMDDVCPRGQLIQFDKYNQTASTGTTPEDPTS